MQGTYSGNRFSRKLSKLVLQTHADSSFSSSSSLLAGKNCLVTGANSGIGLVIARELARMGGSVVMLCRNQAKGEAAKKEIEGYAKTAAATSSVELMIADLASLQSVRDFAKSYKEKHDGKLSILVNNAGLILGKRTETPDGLETTFVVDYLSHFLLTNLLLDALKSSAPSRIVNVTSDAHYSGHIDFDDLQEKRKYSAMKSYCQAKLAQVLFTHELAKRLEGTGVTVNCVHPGAVRTHWGDDAGLLGIGVKLARPFMITPEKGAETPIYVATSPELESVTGKFFAKKQERKSSEESYDENISKHLWEVSSNLVGLQ
jgi:NAD(P)-dependent dehydrogenase (short-subunit alcohol dehydrogenase family)